MNIALDRFLQLRDGKDTPKTRDEMLELARFHFRCEMASIEQSLAQRQMPSAEKIREMEIQAVEKILSIYNNWDATKTLAYLESTSE